MSSSKRPTTPDQAGGPVTLIGRGCRITGVLSGTGNFQINGKIDGDCDLDGSVSITESGYWKGTIHANTILVSGTVDGDIQASGHIAICDTARIHGSVTGETISIAAGAIVHGAVKTTCCPELIECNEEAESVVDEDLQ